MFHKGLSEDLLREIFSYDDTYKTMYSSVIRGAFDDEDRRALKTFLGEYVQFPMTIFDEWLSIRSFHHNRETYYHVEYPDTRMIFHVTSMERKKTFDNPTDPTSPMIATNMLYKLPVDFLRGFVNCTANILERMKRSLTNTMEFNTMVTCMLHAKDYEDLLYHLQVHGKYEEEIHHYLFERMVQDKYGMEYDHTQAFNYDYTEYGEEQYMIMWYEYEL